MNRNHRHALVAAATFLYGCGQQDGDAGNPTTIAERGRTAFRACAVCHSVKDPDAPDYARLIGPSLFAIYGAPAARQDAYDYSRAMREAGVVWDDATLDAYIADPNATVPGNRMSFPGESDPEARAAIIAYLKTLK